jgi:hypothetical protein
MDARRPLTELHGREEDGLARRDEPVTVGVPLARGLVHDAAVLALESHDGSPVPLQAEPLDRWSDGSIRWALLDFPVSLAPRGALALRLVAGGATAAGAGALSCSRQEDAVVVETGAAAFEMATGTAFPFRAVRIAGEEMLGRGGPGLAAIDDAGRESAATVRALTVEARGPRRATVLVQGDFGAASTPLVFFARLHFFAGWATVRMALTVRNPRRAAHPGGVWELGDAGSALLRDVSLRLPCPGARRVTWSESPGGTVEETAGPLELYQDSSGGENWRSRVHRARDGSVPTTFRGFRVRAGATERTGLRASPRVAVHDGRSGVAAIVRHFWEDFPKAIEAGDEALLVRLFPRQWAALHEIQGGEQKTHEVVLSFGPDATGPGADAFRRPLVVAATPRALADSGAIPGVFAEDEDPCARYVRLVGAAFGEDGFPAKRERADEYGWRHFGEMPADHESRGFEGEGTFVSHYNNQYDAVLGAFQQFARTGDPRWFRLMDELARHVVDVDLYHTDEDRPAYNRGLFWPTVHYVDAGLATHRSYPAGTGGGGPDNEHNYTTGLRHWWLLTGNPLGRDAALDGARRVLAADDGALTPFRWITRAPTGFATKTRAFDYHGPGRGAGNSIVALLDAWRTTGEERWISKCDEIVRRTVHPADDVAARGLLDAENRWSYTVHLQALGRYLEDSAEAGRLGAMYAWARESLLAYARWMAAHERPTLERPEALEFPTETWAAQDLRKAEVFAYAALHSQGAERARFEERARWFRDESLAALERFPTRAYTRPLVLLMRHGPMVAWLERNPDAAAPPPREAPRFGRPTRFVPQRTRAIRRIRDVLATAAAAGAGYALARALGA